MKNRAKISVETWPVERLRPYESNPRVHTPEVIAQVASALDRFGFRVPILARSTGDVIDGHLRLKAATHLGLTEVPVIVCDDMSEHEIRAFRISINRMAELADWDESQLRGELERLEADGEKLAASGPIGVELEALDDAAAQVEQWDMSPTRDLFVVTITGPLPMEAEIRERLRGLTGVNIEASTIAQEG